MLTSVNKLFGTTVGAIVRDSKKVEIAQVVGILGTDAKFPNKYIVLQGTSYILFEDINVTEVKADRIFLKF